MNVLRVCFALLVSSPMAAVRSRRLEGTNYKIEFYHSIKDLVFQRIKDHFAPIISDESQLKFMEHIKSTPDVEYKLEEKSITDKDLSLIINDIEIFRILITPHLNEETAEEPKKHEEKEKNGELELQTGLQNEEKKEEEPNGELELKTKLQTKEEKEKTEERLEEETQLQNESHKKLQKERRLAIDMSNNLVIELKNSVLSSTISLEYGFGGGNAINRFVIRVLSNFLFKAEQIIYNLKIIEADLELLTQVEFSKIGLSKAIQSSEKAIFAEDFEKDNVPKVSVEYDIDANYESLQKQHGFTEDQDLLLFLQRVDLDKVDASMKEYFEKRVAETIVAKTNDDKANGDHIIFILTPNKMSLDPVEMLIIQVKNIIYIRATSSYFDFDYQFNISTKRFILKNFERILQRIKYSIYENLSKLQEEKNRPFQIADCVSYLLTRFQPLVFKESETADKAILQSATNIKIKFTITLTAKETDIEFLFTTTPPVIYIKKQYPVNSLYYSIVFFTSFANELYTDLSLVIPKVETTDQKGVVKISPPNNTYFKQMSSPFVEMSADSSQASIKKNNGIFFGLFKDESNLEGTFEYIGSEEMNENNERRKRSWDEIVALNKEKNGGTFDVGNNMPNNENKEENGLVLL